MSMQQFIQITSQGRLLELFLACIKLGLAAWIVATGKAAAIPAFEDLSWYYPALVLAVPFFIVGFLQLVGFVLNMLGYEESWVFRAAGSSSAIFVWLWMVLKTTIADESSPLFAVALVAIPFNILLFYRAYNRLPIPGDLH